MASLRGTVALITGGGQGLGRAFAEQLLRRGAKVSLVDVNQQVGKQAEEALRQQHGNESTLFIQCDVSNKTQLEDAFSVTTKKFGGLDIMVNNAGIGDEDNWEKMIAINLNAVIHGTKLAMEYMRKDKGGKGGLIISTSSVAGIVSPPLMVAYTASKCGVVGFTKSLGHTYPLARIGVRVSCLCPSFTDTQIVEDIRKAYRVDDSVEKEAAQQLEGRFNMMGMMQPSDVANAFMRLVDDERAHGAVLLVTPAGQEYKAPAHIKGKL